MWVDFLYQICTEKWHTGAVAFGYSLQSKTMCFEVGYDDYQTIFNCKLITYEWKNALKNQFKNEWFDILIVKPTQIMILEGWLWT